MDETSEPPSKTEPNPTEPNPTEPNSTEPLPQPAQPPVAEPSSPGEFIEQPEGQTSAYDQAFISSYNALEHSFYMRGREMSSHHWRLRSELEDSYARGGKLPDYEQVSLYHVHK